MKWAIRLNTDRKLWIVKDKDLDAFHKKHGNDVKSKIEFKENVNKTENYE